jgi:hypothetical protein
MTDSKKRLTTLTSHFILLTDYPVHPPKPATDAQPTNFGKGKWDGESLLP